MEESDMHAEHQFDFTPGPTPVASPAQSPPPARPTQAEMAEEWRRSFEEKKREYRERKGPSRVQRGKKRASSPGEQSTLAWDDRKSNAAAMFFSHAWAADASEPFYFRPGWK